MKESLKTFVGAVGLTLCLTTITQAATSITYTVGGWRVTATDLGVLPGGTASSAMLSNSASASASTKAWCEFRAACFAALSMAR